MRNLILLIAPIFIAFAMQAQQEAIQLNNPSFEDFARNGHAPRGWYDCGFEDETPPDTHPAMSGGEFNVSQQAQQGQTYIGLVVRDNETWEAVAQRLRTPLKAGQCYSFSIYVARSILYESLSRVTNEPANYATPSKLRIWAGNGYCDKAFLLAETSEIINTRWLKRTFRFEPDADYYYIQLEASHKTPVLFPYNGNILLDNASEIAPIPCGDEPVAIVDPPEEDEEPKILPPVDNRTTNNKPTPPTNRTDVTQKDPKPNLPPKPTKQEATLGGVKRTELATGKKIQMNRLFFEADKAGIRQSSYEELDQVFDFLKANRDVMIEIGGHTNSLPPPSFCDSLSTARAKAVVEYLVQKGIDEERLKYKGYGKREPIATNKTLSGRQKNQRVEIKILSIDS